MLRVLLIGLHLITDIDGQLPDKVSIHHCHHTLASSILSPIITTINIKMTCDQKECEKVPNYMVMLIFVQNAINFQTFWHLFLFWGVTCQQRCVSSENVLWWNLILHVLINIWNGIKMKHRNQIYDAILWVWFHHKNGWNCSERSFLCVYDTKQ